MTNLVPYEFRPYLGEAQDLLKSGAVIGIEFSRGTYQIEINDSAHEKEVWAFLQLDDRGFVVDSFCTCDEAEETCRHLTTAFLAVYTDHHLPLHLRYENSFWYHLFFLGKGLSGPHITARNSEGKNRLEKIFDDRESETEETSLKFSGLSEEEINAWRRGKPSESLQFELSPWSDCAKWLMSLQEKGEHYTITFKGDSEGIPQSVVIIFPQVEVVVQLSREDLITLIPTLMTVKASLQTFDAKIDCVTYDPERGVLNLKGDVRHGMDQAGIDLDDWIFVADEGFFPKKGDSLFDKEVLAGREVAEVFDQHFHLMKKHLEGTTLHQRPVSVSYTLAFDDNWDLHVKAYLFEEGDLTTHPSRLFTHWAYLDKKGFYRIEGMIFSEAEKIIRSEDITNFIRQNRSWLNGQKGFQTHVSGFETELTYEVSETGQLFFLKKALVKEEGGEAKDFGPWVYIKDEGFFSKVNSSIGLPVKSGVAIHPDQVSLFIRMYKDELELIEGFFSERCPIEKMGLNIALTEEEHVNISPEYRIKSEDKEKEIHYFDGFVYVRGEGFSYIPFDILLPERFLHTIELDSEVLPLFFSHELEQIREYAFYIDPRLESPQFIHLVADRLDKEPGGYRLKLRYVSDRGEVPFRKLWKSLKHKRPFLFSAAGFFDLSEDRYRWVQNIQERQIDPENETLFLSTLDLIKLNAYETLVVHEGAELLEALLSLRVPDEPDTSLLQSELRGYQQVGLRWLWFLYHYHLSGLLCDDMGLGKTHQTMGLISAVSQYKKEKSHHLIVCPTSVIYHWQEKLEQFLPALRVCTFHGSGRSIDDFHEEYDILLTTYGIWRKEVPLLSQVTFDVVIFDEIQAAKNQASRLHTTLLKVKANVRIGLTGTPIENHLRELKSLFDLILPNYMPSDREYRTLFIQPIEQKRNPDRQQLLSRYIKPFVLRRKKSDVLLDLPEKTEEIAHCELVADQKLLYTEVLNNVRGQFIQEIEGNEAPVSYVHIFSALSSLKQICNHPAAYMKTPEAYKDYHSGKWNLFIELLSEALASGQKVVVFSQYLAMLDIIELYLRENEVDYATIRGATTRRGEEVRRFNRDPNCQVFVGSLQAAGLGIDLTAGSVVVHYDRWWNAARENQATDRVHRIGQTRGVQVFKLVSKGTFEERIDEMITRKGKLMEEVVGVDDHRFIKQFNKEEILLLLKPLD